MHASTVPNTKKNIRTQFGMARTKHPKLSGTPAEHEPLIVKHC